MARQHKLPVVEIAPVGRDEIPEFIAALYLAFHHAPDPHDVETMSAVLEPERTLAVRDGGRIVATTGIYSRRLTVPGGADLPLAAVAMVGVRASHRRRGLLTALMQRQLADVHEAGVESLAALWASEGAIYGRFGYGPATLQAELNAHDARLREPAALRADLLPPADARAAMAEIHEAVRPARVGMLDRPDGWWAMRLDDPEQERDGAGVLHAALVDGHAYALYAVKTRWEDRRPEGEVVLRELVAATPEGHAAIWDYLLGLDLTRRVSYRAAPVDEPLPLMVTEPQAVGMRVAQGMWVRLVDVPRALAERAYGAPFEVVLEVADDVCPWNAGRWALRWDGQAADCERSSAPAGLQVSAADLGAAFLGGTTLDRLARAGRVKELRSGALAPASRAFSADLAPWCPETF